ncbi:MAG: hypothetical protein ACREB3_01650, partial [Burkholderiales bacterium]
MKRLLVALCLLCLTVPGLARAGDWIDESVAPWRAPGGGRAYDEPAIGPDPWTRFPERERDTPGFARRYQRPYNPWADGYAPDNPR